MKADVVIISGAIVLSWLKLQFEDNLVEVDL